MNERSTLARALPVLGYVVLLWLLKGWQFAVIATVLGVAMMILFTVWHRSSPDTMASFTHRLNSVVGGPRGEAWRWRRRTRGLVLISIGVLGIPAGLHVIDEPGDFAGGATGGAVFTGLAAVSLLLGLVLIGTDGDSGAEAG